MLAVGATVPDARVWASGVDGEIQLRDAIAGDGPALLCFYAFDWSPG